MERIEPMELPNSQFQRSADLKINEIIDAFNEAIITVENFKLEKDIINNNMQRMEAEINYLRAECHNLEREVYDLMTHADTH